MTWAFKKREMGLVGIILVTNTLPNPDDKKMNELVQSEAKVLIFDSGVLEMLSSNRVRLHTIFIFRKSIDSFVDCE